MKLTKLNLLIIVIVIAAIGYGLGRYASPVKSIEVEKIVEKEQRETSKETRTIKKPDGTIIQEEIVKDTTTKEHASEHSISVDNKKPDWFVAVGYGVNKTVYSAEINRRVLGAVFVGGQVTYSDQDKAVGLVKIGYEF